MSIRRRQQVFQFRIFIQNLLNIRRILRDQIVQRLNQPFLCKVIDAGVGHGRRHHKNIRQIASCRDPGLHDGIIVRARLPVDLHAGPVLDGLPDLQVIVDGHRRVPALQTGYRQIVGFSVSDGKRICLSFR